MKKKIKLWKKLIRDDIYLGEINCNFSINLLLFCVYFVD